MGTEQQAKNPCSNVTSSRTAFKTPAKSSNGMEGRFKRVDADAIHIDNAELADNSWTALNAKGHTYANKAQERLGPVKGKNFRKEMTKAKRGTYRGGAIDTHAVNSVKF